MVVKCEEVRERGRKEEELFGVIDLPSLPKENQRRVGWGCLFRLPFSRRGVFCELI